jgi:hypothetical protein
MGGLDVIRRGMELRRANEPRINDKTTACYYGIAKNTGERLYFLRVDGRLTSDVITQAELDGLL